MNFPSFETVLSTPPSGAAHKRTRSDGRTSHLPPLPHITSDLLLQVYTHVSLRRRDARPEEFGDNERLLVLGKSVFEAVVTSILFHKRPMLDVKKISIQRDQAVSTGSINKYAEMYEMSRRLRCHPDVFSILDTPEEAQTLFYAYIGAVYAERGIETVKRWIDQLIPWLGNDGGIAPPPFVPPLKKIKNEDAPAYVPIFFGSQPPPSPPQQVFQPSPPPQKFPNPLSPAQPGLSFLPLFNQTATQRRLTVNYPAEFSGPSHAGQWTVRCVVNGISKGVGTGSSKQIAKEEAARQAYYAMGWT